LAIQRGNIAARKKMATGLCHLDVAGLYCSAIRNGKGTKLYRQLQSFNNYGPAFSLIIAPFALLPIYVGCWLWAMTGAAALLIAIRKLPLTHAQHLLVIWISAIEMMTATHNVQFNTLLTAFIIFSFVFTINGKDWLATLFIAAGTLSKVYGIAGLLFFFFSRNKIQFIVSYFFWMAVFFFLPMLYSSYDYILQTYEDWFRQILKRNEQNVFNSTYAGMQDISIMGMIRRIFGWYDFPEFKLVAIAGVTMLLPLINKSRWNNRRFLLSYLSLVVLLFLLTILSPTDIIPAYIRNNFIQAYSLKALPCAIIWIVILLDVYTIALKKGDNYSI